MVHTFEVYWCTISPFPATAFGNYILCSPVENHLGVNTQQNKKLYQPKEDPTPATKLKCSS
jgi:hypothetical protein